MDEEDVRCLEKYVRFYLKSTNHADLCLNATVKRLKLFNVFWLYVH